MSRWNRAIPSVAAGAALAVSLGLTGCRQQEVEPTVSAPPAAVEPVAGTRTAVLAVKGMT